MLLNTEPPGPVVKSMSIQFSWSCPSPALSVDRWELLEGMAWGLGLALSCLVRYVEKPQKVLQVDADLTGPLHLLVQTTGLGKWYLQGR